MRALPWSWWLWLCLAGCQPQASGPTAVPTAPPTVTPPPPMLTESPVVRVEGGSTVELAIVRARPSDVRLRVVTAEGQAWETAAQVASRLGALAAINGGYFDENRRALGLVISEGVERNPLRRADWGVFALRGDSASIVHTREFDPAGVDEAIQCGPRLVVDGQPTRLKPSSPTARSAVGIDAEGRVVLVATSGLLELSQFADVLARPATEGGVGCVQAMNLDGGPSTQLAAPGRLAVKGGWPVPNHLVLLPRDAP